MPAKNKIVKQLTAAYLVRDTPSGGFSSTTTAAVAAGVSVVPMTAVTSLVANDIIRIGSGEEMELAKVASIASLNVTLVEPLVYAHVAGEPAVEQTVYDLGDVGGDGVSVTINGATSDVPVSTRRTAYAVLSGYVSAMASFNVPTITLHNILAALGMPLTALTGVGTLASPYHLVTDGNEVNADSNQSLIILSVLGDGTFWREELWGVDADFTGFALKLARGATMTPMSFVASAGGIASTVANPYVAVTTNRPAKGKVFEGLTEVGLFADATVGPLATTTTAIVAAGAAVLPLTAVTNLVAGDWVKVGSGENVEFHQIDNIATLNANLRTKTLRSHISGIAVVRQTTQPFAGIHEDGVDIGFGGSMDPIRIATRKFEAGRRSGLTAITAGFKLIDFTLSNLARALGIPQSAIVGNRLPFNNNVDTAVAIDGFYARGVSQDGGTLQVNFWGVNEDVGSIARTLNNTGIGSIPFTLKPASGIQFIQY